MSQNKTNILTMYQPNIELWSTSKSSSLLFTLAFCLCISSHSGSSVGNCFLKYVYYSEWTRQSILSSQTEGQTDIVTSWACFYNPTDLHMGQFAALLSHASTHAEWNSCSQGRQVSSSSCSNFFRQIGHSLSRSSLRTRVGKDSMKDLEVGGGGLSAKRAEKASSFQFPEVTRNLAKCRRPSGLSPSAKGAQSCSSK